MKVLLVICLVIWYTVDMQASTFDYSSVKSIHVSAIPCQSTIKYWTEKNIQAWLSAIVPVACSSLPLLPRVADQQFDIEEYLQRARVGTAWQVSKNVAEVPRKNDIRKENL